MFLLYSVLSFALRIIAWIVSFIAYRCVLALSRMQDAADDLLTAPASDCPRVSAMRSARLGGLLTAVDNQARRTDVWAGRAVWIGRAARYVASWRGMKLPYTMGIIDVVATFQALDYLHFSKYVSLEIVVGLVRTYGGI